MKAGKLIADNGATFEWDNKSFDFNHEALEVLVNFDNWKSEVTFSDSGNGKYYEDGRNRAWGKRSDYGYFTEAILFNIGKFIDKFPETRDQFIQYLIKLEKKDYED